LSDFTAANGGSVWSLGDQAGLSLTIFGSALHL